MPLGFTGVKAASAEIEARRSSGGSTQSHLWFRLADGEETKVRFLEQEDNIAWCFAHEVPVEGRQWGQDVPCLDQDRDGTSCPGCELDLPRRFKGYINLIWEDAPVFKRNEEGRLVRDAQTNKPVQVGTKPQVAVWSSGIRLFEELAEIDENTGGLTSRRFKVKRKGSGLSTKYVVVPADIDAGRQEFSAEEQELASDKPSLADFVTPPTYEEFEAKVRGETGSFPGGNNVAAAPANPFMRRG